MCKIESVGIHYPKMPLPPQSIEKEWKYNARTLYRYEFYKGTEFFQRGPTIFGRAPGLLSGYASEPTRIAKTSSTLIEVIFTNCLDRVVCSGVSQTSFSHHSVVSAFRKISFESSSKGHNTVLYRKYKNFDFRNDISIKKWDCINIYNDPSGQLGKLYFFNVSSNIHLYERSAPRIEITLITPLLKKANAWQRRS